VLVFGAYVFVDGIFAVVAGIGMRRQLSLWWLVVVEGVVGIILGVLTFRSPDTTALVLLLFIATWSIVTGIFEIATAVRLRKLIANEWLLILSGVVSIIFGALLIAQPGAGAISIVWLLGAYALLFGVLTLMPGAGAISIVWLLGAYALLFGILTLMLAFRLRGMRDTIGRQATGAV
jgi:uncharacterized membrane protein HdeD (DUF308 family)